MLLENDKLLKQLANQVKAKAFTGKCSIFRATWKETQKITLDNTLSIVSLKTSTGMIKVIVNSKGLLRTTFVT